MTRIAALLLAATVLAGCQSTPTRDDDSALDAVYDTLKQDDMQFETDVPAGRAPFNVIDDELKLKMDKDLSAQDRELLINAVFSARERKELYGYTRVEHGKYGPVLVYDSDLGEMKMRIRHTETRKEGTMTVVVPYAYCVDFATDNLGKVNDLGYMMASVHCTQSGLGKDY